MKKYEYIVSRNVNGAEISMEDAFNIEDEVLKFN